MFTEYQVILALSGENDEPAGKPIFTVDHPKPDGKSIVVTLGHKGKYIGVVGVYKPAKVGDPYEFRYQLVELGEEYITPKAEEKNHPIMKLMEDYQTELKGGNYLRQYSQRKHPLQADHPGVAKPEYVGSAECKQCHVAAFKVWEKSAHSKAYKSLVEPEKPNPPSNRQYDPECIVCHTVGFGYETGFFDEKKTANLKDVGCESCHGPCSEHIVAQQGVNKVTMKEWQRAINPWKYLPADQHPLQMAEMCRKCHNLENDVKWNGPEAFDKHWLSIKHYKDMK
jgi:Cytochrome c554 and c-prime